MVACFNIFNCYIYSKAIYDNYLRDFNKLHDIQDFYNKFTKNRQILREMRI